jgi:hypothetical protein
MTATAAPSADFTGSGDFDSFAQTLMSFLFWHLIDSLNIRAVIYSICICWSIPQHRKSQKKRRIGLFFLPGTIGFFIKYSVFLLTLFKSRVLIKLFGRGPNNQFRRRRTSLRGNF